MNIRGGLTPSLNCKKRMGTREITPVRWYDGVWHDHCVWYDRYSLSSGKLWLWNVVDDLVVTMDPVVNLVGLLVVNKFPRLVSHYLVLVVVN